MPKSTSVEANIYTVSQEISHLLRNTEVRCHVHKDQPLIPPLSQMNPVNNLQLYLF